MQTGFELIGKRIETTPINVIVVSNIKCRARIRCPTEQELSFSIRLQRIKINSSANENEARELVGRLECHEILVERYEPRVVSSESLLGKVEIEVERRQRLIVDVRVHTEDRPGPGSSGALQTAAGEGALHRPASAARDAANAVGLTRG